MTTALRRSLVAAASASLVFTGSAFAADAEPTPHGKEMYAATHWLAGQLATAADVAAFDKANPKKLGALVENTLPGKAGATDWDVTIDTLLAFRATGTETEAVGKIAAALPAGVKSFIGPEDARVTGAIAKALIAADKPTEFGGVDLIAELDKLMLTVPNAEGPSLDGKYGKSSTNAEQALAIIGLTKAEQVPSRRAIEFLRRQQCADGGFRLGGDDKPECGPDEHSDAATTALATQALHEAFKPDEVEKPATYLLTTQDATGGFKDTKDLNAVATGLAGQALWVAGKGEGAERAADWVAGMQVTKDTAKLSGDLGAIAFNKAAFDSGVANARDGEITADARAEWRQWTARAVLALTKTGLGHTAPALVLPAEQTETTTSSPTETTSSTTTTSTTTSTDTSSTGSPNLADTGFSAPAGLLVGLALLGSGTALVLLTRRRLPQ
ncbi:Prenyltransferase and squalene oxidase repeat-containing protein [Amycolatopsis xylanica]|uniref:Prenyltransferase and squalene oxidase repeat-containing protein n=1 Tax=Amycolatopsis xylanica TaxID=589385 RepID=A0A1H2ZW21_9PSEU|nr:prenyltransferase/squalene oxidase repeat-containing protein [Amycolatopsis xylanica]SDX21750.1 Prenyltransferase and squalene oxidase repeat-containing protein [Amycolatopsis xylanica]